MSNRILTKTEWLASLEELWEAEQQPRPWVGLTDEELGKIINANWGVGAWGVGMRNMARAIEAKLKEKNT